MTELETSQPKATESPPPADLAALQAANTALAAELAAVKQELEAFAYSVSHDLRAPLRSIDGFSLALEEECAPQLSGPGLDYLKRVRGAAHRMTAQIDGLLALSRIGRAEFRRLSVDLAPLADGVAADLREKSPDGPAVTFVRPDRLPANGDPRLLKVLLEHLLGNAWKFTSRRADAQVELGLSLAGEAPAYFVRDNGAGFDMAYADRLFGAFQRLHDQNQYSGTGIGLAIVRRIINRHGGRIWAEAQVEAGATFYFTLGT